MILSCKCRWCDYCSGAHIANKVCLWSNSSIWWLAEAWYLNLFCRTEIFYPSMRALARRMGKERGYEVLISGRQSLQPPPGASEVDVKTFQVAILAGLLSCMFTLCLNHRRLLSCTNCWRTPSATWSERCRGGLTESWRWWLRSKLNRKRASLQVPKTPHKQRETHRVVQEATKYSAWGATISVPCVRTELWKKVPLKHTLSPERPQVVETFIQQLTEGAEETEGQVRSNRVGLKAQCVTFEEIYWNKMEQKILKY